MNNTLFSEIKMSAMHGAILALSLICLMSSLSQADVSTDHYYAYVNALIATPGALTAVTDISGWIIPANGNLAIPAQGFIFDEMYDFQGNPTRLGYTNPTQAALNWVHADAYLQALRLTPGALDAYNTANGQDLPANGTLSFIQYQYLFTQLANTDGSPSLAYTNPAAAAQALVTPSNPTTTTTTSTNTAELALGIALLVGLGAALLLFNITDLLPLLGMGALAVLAVFLIINSQKKTDQTLGAGDAPVLVSTSTLVASQLKQATSISTSQVQNNEAGTSLTMMPPSPSVSAATPVGAYSYVTGIETPNLAYKSFYLATGKGPTGLSANSEAVSAVAQQKSKLTVAANPIAPVKNAAVESAATVDKNVTLSVQNQ